jgi:hypothetical protein
MPRFFIQRRYEGQEWVIIDRAREFPEICVCYDRRDAIHIATALCVAYDRPNLIMMASK